MQQRRKEKCPLLLLSSFLFPLFRCVASSRRLTISISGGNTGIRRISLNMLFALHSPSLVSSKANDIFMTIFFACLVNPAHRYGIRLKGSLFVFRSLSLLPSGLPPPSPHAMPQPPPGGFCLEKLRNKREVGGGWDFHHQSHPPPREGGNFPTRNTYPINIPTKASTCKFPTKRGEPSSFPTPIEKENYEIVYLWTIIIRPWNVLDVHCAALFRTYFLCLDFVAVTGRVGRHMLRLRDYFFSLESGSKKHAVWRKKGGMIKPCIKQKFYLHILEFFDKCLSCL